MYHPTIPVLYTSEGVEGQRSYRDYLHTNGTHVRTNYGALLWKTSPERGPIIYFMAEDRKGRFRGVITDEVLAERIKRYWDEYFGVRYTNCSTFAHYLTTGIFVECEEERSLLVIKQGMRPYEMASRIDIGDMVCLFYADDKKARSRKSSEADRYRRVRKRRHDTEDFSCAAAMYLKSRAFSPDEIRDIYTWPWVDDYHFMVCVSIWRGQPVWVSQSGRFLPGTDEEPVFSLTRGEKDAYPEDVPALVLIKKRR